jgi:release factor glutamine methyltransferase
MTEETRESLDRAAIYERGEIAFMGHDFYVERSTIIPRDVSGIVILATEERLKSGALARLPGEPLRFVDMCGGSGNIGSIFALRIPDSRGYTCDLMAVSSALAKRNIERHGLADRLEARTGDLFGALEGLGLEGKVDVITCSPPFISTGRLTKDRAYLLEEEPREAFDAGPYGTSILSRVVKEALPFLRPGGLLVCEFGEGQRKQVELLVGRTKAYDLVEIVPDADGIDRAVAARKAVAAAPAV